MSRNYWTAADADKVLKSKVVEVERQQVAGDLGVTADTTLTVGRVVLDYITNHVKRSGLNVEFYESMARTLTPDPLWSMKAVKVNKNDVRELRRRLAESGRRGGKRSASTVNAFHAVLRAAFNYAVDGDQLDRNPFARVKMERPNNKRDRVLTVDEYARLLAGCAPYLRDLVELAWETGARREELESLTWRQVSIEQKTIRLEQTKNGEDRTVPLSERAEEILRSAWGSRKGRVIRRGDEGKVFLHIPSIPAGSTVWRGVGRTKIGFNSACRRAKIEDFRFHDLRHCFVSRKRAQGVPDHVIRAIVGHKTPSMTDRYTTVAAAEMLAAVRRAG
jgi:integrase